MRLGIGIDSPYWSVEPQPRRRPQKFEEKDKENSSLAERTRSSDRKEIPRGRVIRIPPIGTEDMLEVEDDRDTESAPSEEDVDPLHHEQESGSVSSTDVPSMEKREVECKAEKSLPAEQIKKEVDDEMNEPISPTTSSKA